MSSTEVTTILAGIFLVFVTVSVLVGIIIKQRQTIKDYENPRYGFLGKKLSAYLLGVTTLAIAGFVLFPNNLNTRDTSISVSDNQYSLSISINTEMFGAKNVYRFTLEPYFDGELWGRSSSYFAVTWQINDNEFYEIIGPNNPGGIVTVLKNGKNVIRGTIGLYDEKLTKEIIIFVDNE